MSAFDKAILAEKLVALERHLTRVRAKLPARPEELLPSTDASDAVVLHLWQATQLTVDVALAAAVALKLGTPQSYADAFRLLSRAGHLEPELAERLARAAGFRNVIARAYEGIDLARVHAAASMGPPDLRAFFHAMARVTPA